MEVNEDWVEKCMWMYKGQARPRGRLNENWLEVVILFGKEAMKQLGLHYIELCVSNQFIVAMFSLQLETT